METLLLQSKSKKDIQLFVDLAKKVGLKTKFITDANLEDIGLANAMKKGRTGEFVNTEAYLKKLKSK
jgi:cyanate lyase